MHAYPAVNESAHPPAQNNSIVVAPLDRIDVEVYIPGSKSYTNRAVVIGALAEGTTTLEHPLIAEDTTYIASAVQQYGRAAVLIDEAADQMTIARTPGNMTAPVAPIFMGNAGTPIRCLTSFASLAAGTSVITGDERMQQRPIQDLIEALQQLGVPVRTITGSGCPPIELVGQGLRGGHARIRGSVSSQYTTSILLAAAYAEQDVELTIVDDLTSKPYVDMTLAIMRAFGVEVERSGYAWFRVRAGQRYQARTYRIEPDASNMSYFLAAAAVVGGRVRVRGIDMTSVQGDVQFVKVLERMGCAITAGAGFIEIRGGPLRGVEVDMNWMPDLVPTLAIVAAYAEGPTHITNIANLRIKECDRIAAMEMELRKMRIQVESTADSLTIYGGRPQAAEIDTYNDHRIAMSFAVAGLRTPDVIIRNPACVAKSFPSFWQVFDGLRG
jgi:3-phosphoshikimate 1-carboxyvinyltransferase